LNGLRSPGRAATIAIIGPCSADRVQVRQGHDSPLNMSWVLKTSIRILSLAGSELFGELGGISSKLLLNNGPGIVVSGIVAKLEWSVFIEAYFFQMMQHLSAVRDTNVERIRLESFG